MQEQPTTVAPSRKAKGNSSPEYMAKWREKRKQHVRDYSIWYGMVARCHNTSNDKYSYYGGRGIQVCERWRNSFTSFLEDMGSAPEGMSIDRIDNNRDYEPSNCRWATPKDQCRNRRSNRLVTAFGKTKTLAEWADDSGMSQATLWKRLNKPGTSPDDAVSIPVNRKKTGRKRRSQ